MRLVRTMVTPSFKVSVCFRAILLGLILEQLNNIFMNPNCHSMVLVTSLGVLVCVVTPYPYMVQKRGLQGGCLWCWLLACIRVRKLKLGVSVARLNIGVCVTRSSLNLCTKLGGEWVQFGEYQRDSISLSLSIGIHSRNVSLHSKFDEHGQQFLPKCHSSFVCVR